MHKIFDEKFEVKSAFLVLENAISGKSIGILSDFLKHRKQRVSSWTCINTQVPQGSILGLLLF